MILDAGDQPAIGIVGEGREVRAAMGFAVLAGLRVGRDRDDGVVDRTEATEEPAVGDAQPDLGRLPGLTGGLGAQHIAHRVADRQQGADDLSVAGQDAAAAFALPDRDGADLAVHDLHQLAGLAEQVRPFLDRGAVGGGADRRGRSGFAVRIEVSADSSDAVKISAGSRSRAAVSRVSSATPSSRGRQV